MYRLPRFRVTVSRVLLLAAALVMASTALAQASTAPGAHLRALSLRSPHLLGAQRVGGLDQVPGSASNGFSPAQIRSAYRLPARGARHQKVAIIAAFNDPQIASDLAAYARNFNLPSCTVASGCLSIHNEMGQASPLPPTDPTGQEWLTETSLDVEAVHGICESCSIAIYEANSPESADMSTAVNAASAAGATVVVTTFQPTESSTDTDFALDYNHQKTAVVSATGEVPGSNYGYGGEINFPSSLNYVTAVGGTDLSLAGNGSYRRETVASNTVSGCSLFALAAPWQVGDTQAVGCGMFRSVADLSADSNPGMVIYASHLSIPGGPWFQATGTSVAAPIIAAEIGLAGSLGSAETQGIYAHEKADPQVVHDITSGRTSPNCTTGQCRAGKGYDGPSGLGSPYGLGAFLATGGALPSGTPNLHEAKGRINVGTNWRIAEQINSDIPVAVTGTAYVKARIHGRLVTLASQRLSMGPMGSEPFTVTVPDRYRSALQGHRWPLQLQLKVHGVGGRTGSVTRYQTTFFAR